MQSTQRMNAYTVPDKFDMITAKRIFPIGYNPELKIM